jgi:hypothetical protein
MPALSESMQDARYRQECRAAGVLAVYNRLRKAGNNPGFAAMLALKTPPGSKSDREFARDFAHGKQFDKMGKASREHILREAKRAGINITGKIFKSGLGKPSDPLAWVSDSGDVLRTAKLKGLHVTGRVNYTPPELPPPPPVPLAQDLLRNRVLAKTAADPALAARCRKNPKLVEEIKEQVLAEAVPERRRKRILQQKARAARK